MSQPTGRVTACTECGRGMISYRQLRANPTLREQYTHCKARGLCNACYMRVMYSKGLRATPPIDELIEDVEWLLGTDNAENIARRVGYDNASTLARRLIRHGRNDLAQHFDRHSERTSA